MVLCNREWVVQHLHVYWLVHQGVPTGGEEAEGEEVALGGQSLQSHLHRSHQPVQGEQHWVCLSPCKQYGQDATSWRWLLLAYEGQLEEAATPRRTPPPPPSTKCTSPRCWRSWFWASTLPSTFPRHVSFELEYLGTYFKIFYLFFKSQDSLGIFY